MNQNSITIDWLRMSFASGAYKDIEGFFGGFDLWAEKAYFNRKFLTMPIEGVQVCTDHLPEYDDLPKGRFTVNFSGNGLGHVFKTFPHWDLIRLCRHLLSLEGAKVNRLDVAFDDKSELLDIGHMARQVERRENVVSRWRKSSMIRSCDDKGRVALTLYVGNRQSDSFLRVYDKRMQELQRGTDADSLPPHWVRCELELKNKVADAVLRDLAKINLSPSAMVGLLRDKIDFRQSGDGRPQRRPIARWWGQFTHGLEKRPIRVPLPVQSIERKERWTQDSVAPTLALLMEEYDGDLQWLFDAIKDGKRRLTNEHKSLLSKNKGEDGS